VGWGKGGAISEAAELQELLAGIERFCSRPRCDQPPDQVGEELIGLRHACDQLELEFSKLAAEFAATDEAEDQGSVSPIDWIRHQCKMSGYQASERVCVGQEVTILPRGCEALAQGRIGFGHLSLLASTSRALTSSRTASAFDEEELLHSAQEMSVGRFRYLCAHARHAGDAEAFARQQADQVDRRWLELKSHEEGDVSLRGTLDAIGGAALRTALEPLARRQGHDDDRGRERRLADALIELAGHGLDAGVVPQRASQRTHLQVTTSLETLLGLAGSPAADLEFSPPISAKTVERLACDCSVTRVLLGADSAVVDVGRSRRVVSGSTRRALNVRDQHCQWPGCERPASWTAAHHLVHWTCGGDTNLANLVLLCYRHHWMVHEGGWQLVRDDERLLTIPPVPRFHQPRAPDASAAA